MQVYYDYINISSLPPSCFTFIPDLVVILLNYLIFMFSPFLLPVIFHFHSLYCYFSEFQYFHDFSLFLLWDILFSLFIPFQCLPCSFFLSLICSLLFRFSLSLLILLFFYLILLFSWIFPFRIDIRYFVSTFHSIAISSFLFLPLFCSILFRSCFSVLYSPFLSLFITLLKVMCFTIRCIVVINLQWPAAKWGNPSSITRSRVVSSAGG